METQKEKINAWFISLGWKPDEAGHLFKTFKGKLHRIVMKKTVWQNDIQTPSGKWRRVEGGRYSQTTIIDGKLYGEKHIEI